MLNGDLIWEVAGKSYRSRDGWEMTEQGRAFAAQLRTRRQAKPEASLSE